LRLSRPWFRHLNAQAPQKYGTYEHLWLRRSALPIIYCAVNSVLASSMIWNLRLATIMLARTSMALSGVGPLANTSGTVLYNGVVYSSSASGSSRGGWRRASCEACGNWPTGNHTGAARAYKQPPLTVFCKWLTVPTFNTRFAICPSLQREAAATASANRVKMAHCLKNGGAQCQWQEAFSGWHRHWH
jgi:hypothetical protein